MSSTVTKELENHVEELQVSTGIDIHNEIWFQALHYIFVFSPSVPIGGLLALSGEIIINLNTCSQMHVDALSETRMSLLGSNFTPEFFGADEDLIFEAVLRTIIHEELHKAIVLAEPTTTDDSEHFAMERLV